MNCPIEQATVNSDKMKKGGFAYNDPIISRCNQAYVAKFLLVEEINEISVRYAVRGLGRFKSENILPLYVHAKRERFDIHILLLW